MKKVLTIPRQVSALLDDDPKSYYYMTNVDMRKRSSGIIQDLMDYHGVSLRKNSVIIADSVSERIRSYVTKAPHGLFELRYHLTAKGKLIPLSEKEGRIKLDNPNSLEHFSNN